MLLSRNMFVHPPICQQSNRRIIQRFCSFHNFLNNQRPLSIRGYHKTIEETRNYSKLLCNSSLSIEGSRKVGLFASEGLSRSSGSLHENGEQTYLYGNRAYSTSALQEANLKTPSERGGALSTYYGNRSGEKNDQLKTEELLYDMFKDPDTGLVMIGKFIAGLQATGLRKNDPRLSNLMLNLRKVHKESGREGGSYETQKVDKENFQKVIAGDLVLISRAFRNHFIIPDFQDFCKDIEEFYWSCKTNTSGKVASYIPQLARANPDWWGVSVCTVDGQRFSIGDVSIPFTLQSCSKPLTYGIALDHLGEDVVHKYVGQEPSGRMFNELVLDYNMKPHNPMINAGAILICSLLKTLIFPNMTLAEKFDFTMDVFKRLAGGEYIGFNNAVFLSEREAADRNYALGFYMREHKCFPDKANLKESMDFYFQCCSMESTCDSIAVMAATLANGGICPLTEEKVLNPDSIRNVLSLMHSCGMYDYSGQFAFKVGLPAKSGVSGGMLVVIPNVMGISCWSPPLDSMGNSCRGVQLCQELVRVFNFHRYDNLKHAPNKKDPRRYKYESKGMNIVNLLFAAASGDLAALRRQRLSGLDMTCSDYDGRTALHLASAEGHLDCVKFLIEQCNVNPFPKDRWGNTPLKEAETFKHAVVVEYLSSLKAPSKMDKEEDAGESPISEIPTLDKPAKRDP